MGREEKFLQQSSINLSNNIWQQNENGDENL